MSIGQQALTVAGAPVPLSVYAGTSDTYHLSCVDPTLSPIGPLVLTGGSLSFVLKARDVNGAPTGVVLLSKTPTITDAVNGLADLVFAPADTSGLAAGAYDWELWFTDASGNKSLLVPPSMFRLSAT